METLKQALAAATSYWEANESARCRGAAGVNVMASRAERCVRIVGINRRLVSLKASDGAALLATLRKEGLSRSSVASYYGAFRRMLSLAGVSTELWPKAPTPERRVRTPVEDERIEQIIDALEAEGWPDTAALVRLMRDTGLRVDVEALRGRWEAKDGRLVVYEGKGGHGRELPYKGPERGPLRGVTYETHLRRIKRVQEGSDVVLLPHDFRRAFCKRVYERSGNNIRVAQALMGHAGPSTTANYIGVGWDELTRATG